MAWKAKDVVNGKDGDDKTYVFDKGRDLDAAAASIQIWLNERLAPAEVGAVHNLRYPVGAGTSNETILFEAVLREDGRERIEPLVLRISPDEENRLFLDTGFDAQYQVMDVLGRKGLVRVARMVGMEHDPALMGRPFYVMEQLQGQVPVSFPVYNKSGWLFDSSPEARRIVWESGLREMTRIHLVPPADVDFLTPKDPALNGLQASIAAARAHFDWARDGVELPWAERIYERVIKDVPLNPTPGLSWGDARMGNMMFGADNHIAGVMDWEQVSLGGPLLDLAWWLHFDEMHSTAQGLERLPGLGERDETIDIWQEATGLTAGNLGWYETFTAFRLSCLSVRMFFLQAGRDGIIKADDHNRQSFERLMDRAQ